jgi:hypothetical protein
MLRRILAACALVLLVALQFDYNIACFPFLDREAFHRYFTRMPDGQWEQYPRFLHLLRHPARPEVARDDVVVAAHAAGTVTHHGRLRVAPCAIARPGRRCAARRSATATVTFPRR